MWHAWICTATCTMFQCFEIDLDYMRIDILTKIHEFFIITVPSWVYTRYFHNLTYGPSFFIQHDPVSNLTLIYENWHSAKFHDSNLKLDHVGSKTRSLGQFLGKPCVHSRGHSFEELHIFYVYAYANVGMSSISATNQLPEEQVSVIGQSSVSKFLPCI